MTRCISKYSWCTDELHVWIYLPLDSLGGDGVPKPPVFFRPQGCQSNGGSGVSIGFGVKDS